MSYTCEDRDYLCCDLFPPVVVVDGEVYTELTEAEYDAWFDAHVAAYEAAASGQSPTLAVRRIGPDAVAP